MQCAELQERLAEATAAVTTTRAQLAEAKAVASASSGGSGVAEKSAMQHQVWGGGGGLVE